jgi:hypothetical protein
MHEMALDAWLSIDGILRDEAPEDLRSSRGLTLRKEALVFERGGHITVAPWSAVLAVVRLPRAVFVLVPRKPPSPPWIEIDETLAAELGAGALDALEASLLARAESKGYRDAGPTRALLPPPALYKRLVGNDLVPGTVEVPIGYGPGGRKHVLVKAFEGALGFGGGAFGGAYAGAILTALLSAPAAPVVLGSAALAAGAGLATTLYMGRDRKARGRVLALAPDGVVIGLPTGVRAYGWSAIRRFGVEPREVFVKGRRQKDPHLVVTGADGRLVGALHRDWFDRPLALIVSVAEAYRTRFTT